MKFDTGFSQKIVKKIVNIVLHETQIEYYTNFVKNGSSYKFHLKRVIISVEGAPDI
jgi:hypothetical protein